MKLVAAAKSAAMHEIRAESCRCGSNSSMHRADDKPAEAGGTWITWDNGISLSKNSSDANIVCLNNTDLSASFNRARRSDNCGD